MFSIKGNLKDWNIVVGLEIHAQIKSQKKLFSLSDCRYGISPNTSVSIFDAALPGTLPTLNKICLLEAAKTGLALSGKVQNYSRFDRKNYFYHDLPSGYQITQFYHPIVIGGKVAIKNYQGNNKEIRIHHIHLEQDAGKSVHVGHETYIDLNRAGIPLLEIVSEPDIRSPEEAVEYVKNIRQILRYIDVCDANLEKGEMRCDANVSVNIVGSSNFGTRCEIKNLNSFKSISKAIECEAKRQISILENGQSIESQTMLFDIDYAKTIPMRSKENSNEYRYFPDPDIPPVYLSSDFINNIVLPELPYQKFDRYVNKMGISEYHADILVSDLNIASYFEEVIKQCPPNKAANWITGELFAYLKKYNVDILNSKVNPEHLIDIILLIEEGSISETSAKKVFYALIKDNVLDVRLLVDKLGLKQINDSVILQKIMQEVIDNNKDKVQEYKKGKVRLLGFFIGQVMSKTSGKANPIMLNKIAKELLDY